MLTFKQVLVAAALVLVTPTLSLAQALPHWLDPTVRATNHGDVPYEPRTMNVRKGGTYLVAGLRSANACGSPAPRWPVTSKIWAKERGWMGAQIPNGVKIVHLGTGRYPSPACKGQVVPAVVVGVTIPANYSGPKRFNINLFGQQSPPMVFVIN